jgi:hypothetical protein
MEGNEFGSRMFIPDPGDPVSRVKKIPDSGSASASMNISILALKTVSQLSEKLSGMFIPDPDFFPSRIQGSKKHRTPDPDPQHKLITVSINNYHPYPVSLLFIYNTTV